MVKLVELAMAVVNQLRTVVKSILDVNKLTEICGQISLVESVNGQSVERWPTQRKKRERILNKIKKQT